MFITKIPQKIKIWYAFVDWTKVKTFRITFIFGIFFSFLPFKLFFFFHFLILKNVCIFYILTHHVQKFMVSSRLKDLTKVRNKMEWNIKKPFVWSRQHIEMTRKKTSEKPRTWTLEHLHFQFTYYYNNEIGCGECAEIIIIFFFKVKIASASSSYDIHHLYS